MSILVIGGKAFTKKMIKVTQLFERTFYPIILEDIQGIPLSYRDMWIKRDISIYFWGAFNLSFHAANKRKAKIRLVQTTMKMKFSK